MKKVSGRLISCLLVIFMAVSLMAGCTGNKGGTGDTAAASTTAAVTSGAASAVPEPEKPVYPLDTDVTLTYWNEMNPNVSANYANMGDTPYAKELTARTGIKVEYLHSTTDESFSLLLASGDLPDIIEFWWDAYPGGPLKAVKDGMIIPLNDLMDEYAPNFTQWLEEHPDIARQIRWDEGQYIGFPAVNGAAGDDARISMGFLLRQDLLDKLGLAVPETIDEWQAVLEGFKSLGVSAPFTAKQIFETDTFARAYGLQLTSNGNIYLENGKVVYGPMQPAFKDYLTVMNKWYKEGLIDKDVATIDDNLVKAKMLDGSAASTVSYISMVYTYNTTGVEKIPGYKLVGAPLPVLKKGDVNTYSLVSNPYETWDVQAVITKNCKHPEIAARLLDYLWGEEGRTLANWGIEGKTYTVGSDGKKHYTDFVKKNPDGLSAGQVKGGYSRAYASGPYPQDGNLALENFSIPEQFATSDLWSKSIARDHLLPPLRRTAEEDEEYTKIMTDVNTYYQESTLKFILGNVSLDSFDNYIAQMKKLKIDRAIEIQQAAYDRYLKR